MPVSESSRVLAAICAQNARMLSRANALQIHRGTRCTFNDHSRQQIGHHQDQDRAVLGVIKALAALDPSGCGLDAASAQLEGRTYVMADEARPHFCVDGMRRRSYREDLVGAVAHPSAVSPGAER
jgi:hypothetical protein